MPSFAAAMDEGSINLKYLTPPEYLHFMFEKYLYSRKERPTRIRISTFVVHQFSLEFSAYSQIAFHCGAVHCGLSPL